MKFIHRISKGSKFNQIYVPKDKEEEFGVGDLVEVRLIEKKVNLYYSKNLRKLNPFKEKLVRELFVEIVKLPEVQQIFVFGSFLTKEIDYNDIDILVISEEEIEEEIYKNLIKKFSLKFHVISINKDRLEKVLRVCPLTRSMLYSFVSNKPFTISEETEIDKNHILYLLMMPEDLLKIELNSGIFYNNIRKLITIERFLEDKDANPKEIESSLEDLIKEPLLSLIKKNEQIEKNSVDELRRIIKLKIKSIKRKL